MQERNTDKDWKRVAETDPYWAVLSIEKFKGHNDLEGPIAQEFFASGEQFVQSTFSLIKTHFGSTFSPKRAIDFGCGVGRLLIPLARLSERACGVDVAPRMLELCRGNLDRTGLERVELVLGDDDLSGLEGTFDFILSHLVFQHIPPTRGYALLSKLLSKLEGGGLASIQLTYGRSRRFLQNDMARGGFIRREGENVIGLIPPREPPPEGTITMYDYDLNTIYAMLNQLGTRPILALPTSDNDHLGTQLIFQKHRKK